MSIRQKKSIRHSRGNWFYSIRMSVERGSQRVSVEGIRCVRCTLGWWKYGQGLLNVIVASYLIQHQWTNLATINPPYGKSEHFFAIYSAFCLNNVWHLWPSPNKFHKCFDSKYCKKEMKSSRLGKGENNKSYIYLISTRWSFFAVVGFFFFMSLVLL